MDSDNIKQCSCEHAFQDERYGKGKRVCTKMANGQYKCTVCSSTHGTSKTVKEK